MLQANQLSEYDCLFEKYNKMSDEELSNITKPENGYTELAIKVASDILQSDRTEYYKEIEQKQKTQEEKQKIDKSEILVNINKDIHSIKNVLLFFVILTIIGLLFGAYTIFVTIPNIF